MFDQRRANSPAANKWCFDAKSGVARMCGANQIDRQASPDGLPVATDGSNLGLFGMIENIGQKQNRRDLLRAAIRAISLFLGVLGAAYVTRPRSGQNGQCTRLQPCGECPALPSCEFSEASRTRRPLSKKTK